MNEGWECLEPCLSCKQTGPTQKCGANEHMLMAQVNNNPPTLQAAALTTFTRHLANQESSSNTFLSLTIGISSSSADVSIPHFCVLHKSSALGRVNAFVCLLQ